MKTYFIVGMIFVALGVLGVAYDHFSFTKETHDAKIGPIEFSIKEKEHVAVPDWAAWGAIAAGASIAAFGVLLKPGT